MGRTLALVLVVASCCWPLFATVAMAEQGAVRCDSGAEAPRGSPGPTITAVLPNPVADGDAGEAVALALPRTGTPTNLTITDGESTVSIPDSLEGTTVIVTNNDSAVPEAPTPNSTAIDDGLSLSNGGETIRVRADGRPLDCVRYRDAPEGEWLLAGRAAADPHWRPVGATDFDVTDAGPGTVRAFVLPDAPRVPIQTLRAADRRLLLAGYTLTSHRVERALLAAERRGVAVRVLVDAEPVGGMSAREAGLLDNLSDAGVAVRALGGPHTRYEFHHAKYTVVDDRALVTTENFKPAGTGGHGSRGWGVVTSQAAVVDRLADVFEADWTWRAARPWTTIREDLETQSASAAKGSYPTRIEPVRVSVDGARVLVAPDNAEGAVVRAIDRANQSVDVIQMTAGGRSQPFVRAAVRAARRGVAVRVLLSGAWYAEAKNRRVVQSLREAAARESLPLEARLADPRGRFEKIHAKGVVVDGQRVIVGSLNWNNHSARENREIALVLEGEAVGGYFQRAFASDWRGVPWAVPAGLVLLALLVVGVALLRAAAIRFDCGGVR